MTDTSTDAVEAFIKGPLRDAVLSEGVPTTPEDTRDVYAAVDLLRALAAERDALRADKEAAVAAEREACAECCTAELRNTAQLMSNPPQSSAAWNAGNAIRARGDTDALVERDAQVMAEALREAAAIKLDVEVRNDCWRHAALDTEAAYRKAILAIIPADQEGDG